MKLKKKCCAAVEFLECLLSIRNIFRILTYTYDFLMFIHFRKKKGGGKALWMAKLVCFHQTLYKF